MIDFCDELTLVDHRSRDRTPEILERFAAESPIPTSVHHVRDPAVSHELIAAYAGEDVWAFGVEGDELYDPNGVARFRPRLLLGEFADVGSLKGIQLHCRELDLEARGATGWLAPPARSTTKLFNFSLLSSWDGDATERFHGGTAVRRRPVRIETIRDEKPWDEADFRCLHVCFLRRSSIQPEGERARESRVERRAHSRLRRARDRIRSALGEPEESWWKLNKYAQGEPVTVDVPGFLARAEAVRIDPR